MKRIWITLLLLTGALAGLSSTPAWAHDVKDPVCRMTVDSDTAKFHYKLGNKTFYFCSLQCESKFKSAPEKYSALATQLEKNDLHDYTVDLQTDGDPLAGRPVRMEIAIRYADTKELVKEFELVHERQLHFIMTTEDMSWFEHQHPTRGNDGLFHLTWTFPHPGKYRLYADFTPADGDNQVKEIPLTVGGGGAAAHPLTPDTARVKQVGDLRFTLRVRPGAPLRMEKPSILTYTIHDARGRLVTDAQPYIGAMGHLLAISADGKEFVHTHVLQTASQTVEPGRPRVTPAMISPKGPVFSFMLTLPTGGLYKTWAQFMHGNKVYTVPFTLAVQDLWDAGPRTVHGASGNVQRATIVVDGEFQPAQLTVEAGRPVALTFIRKEKIGCGNLVQIPSLHLKRLLKSGEKTVFTFTPTKAGTVAFTCGMGMYQGQIQVR